MAITPLLAPDPIAWLCSAFRIDDDFAREIKAYTDLEITFLDGQNFFATTFHEKNRTALAATLRGSIPPPRQIVDVVIRGEKFLSYSAPLVAENANTIALLQRSLDKELVPYLRLERTYLFLALFGLAISAVLGIWIARDVSRPVLQLAQWARKIAAGDHEHRAELKRKDELGSLATSFNQMSEGLAERDRVRAGSGYRAVAKGSRARWRRTRSDCSISDLRRFTSMSEELSPQETLGILNHYFTRMAAIVEKHGGVIDKYVGDALMALFGAPLASPDDADRALKAALEMTEALDDMNRQWPQRGLPSIDIGIGINTDVVVAGNMGSVTRLNYTVIGDGVNLASRSEGLTKTPEYATRIIISFSTLAKARERYRMRRLGEVAVKGKQKATEIFALLGREWLSPDDSPNFPYRTTAPPSGWC